MLREGPCVHCGRLRTERASTSMIGDRPVCYSTEPEHPNCYTLIRQGHQVVNCWKCRVSKTFDVWRAYPGQWAWVCRKHGDGDLDQLTHQSALEMCQEHWDKFHGNKLSVGV